MSKLSGIKNWAKNLVGGDDAGQSDKSDTAKEAQEDAAMAEGVADEAYGLKRKALYAILGIIVVAFTSFTWFSSMGSDEDAKKQGQQEQEATLSQQNNKDTGKLPNDYEQLQKMNAQRWSAQNGQKPSQQNQPGQPGQNGTARNNTTGNQQPRNTNANASVYQAPQTSLPAIPQRTYNAPFTPTYLAAQGHDAENAPAAQSAEKEKDKYSAAIDFGVVKDNDSHRSNSATAMPTTAIPNDNATALPAGVAGNAALGAVNATGLGTATGNVPMQSLMSGGAAYMAPTPNSIQAGTVIPAVLLTGINTDVGGQVIAQVSSDVYDSLTGQTLLIPAGSRLVGSIEVGAKDTQSRVNVSWQYLMLPSGGSYTLGGSIVAADCGGYAGLAGKVNHHTGRMARAGFFSSALAALGSLAAGNTNGSNNTYSAGQLAAQGAMANMMNSASALFKRGMDQAQTTITVAPGSEFVAYVTQTIQLNPYGGSGYGYANY